MLRVCRHNLCSFFHTTTSQHSLSPHQSIFPPLANERKASRSKRSRREARPLPFELREKPVFERDALPHNSVEASAEEEEGTTGPKSFRRRSVETSERDWIRRERLRKDGKDGWVLELKPQPKSLRHILEADLRRGTKVRRFSTSTAHMQTKRAHLPPPKPLVKPMLKGTPRGKISFTTSPQFGFLNSESFPSQEPPAQGGIKKFSSPPLLVPLLSCLTDLLGPGARPTEIQSLAMQEILPPAYSEDDQKVDLTKEYKEYLLASETGSGKSLAYLLPLLQSLKLSENPNPRTTKDELPLNPRAIVLTPTHELSRQTSGFAKALLHAEGARLRVLCASSFKPPKTKTKMGGMTPAKMKSLLSSISSSEELVITPDTIQRTSGHPVDVVIGTPMKIMELVRGRGWDRSSEPVPLSGEKSRRGRDIPLLNDSPPKIGARYMGLENIEWVVVDEADVLFDPDFQKVTRLLLSSISSSRGTTLPLPSQDIFDPSSQTTPPTPIKYPFSLLLSTATIPTYLSSYLQSHHPTMKKLVSSGIHHFPKSLDVEYVSWAKGMGNKMGDVERKIRKVFSQEARFEEEGEEEGKVLIFVNRSTKVDQLSEYLTEKGVKNVALTSASEERKIKGNKYLDGFLKPIPRTNPEVQPTPTQPTPTPALRPLTPLTDPTPTPPNQKVEENPRVLITTSLLSRGLDFSPTIKHVFIVDEPRNLVDFLHRAGRAARAGHKGKVVIFGDFGDARTVVSHHTLLPDVDTDGRRRKVRREGERGKEVRRRVGELRLARG